MTALSVANLSVAQRGPNQARLTTGVSFAVERGEALAIVGESGSGKSLTARAVMALLPPNLTAAGRVTINGVATDADPSRTAPLRGSTIALLMQDPFTMLHPLRRVGPQLADGLTSKVPRRRGERRRIITDRLAEVGLDRSVADRYPHELSGGMRQRVGLAAALLRDPSILIADEPTTALDATTQREVLQLITGLQRRRGMAMVLITHNLGLAFSTCDQVLVLYAGRTMEHGPANDVHRRAFHPYTAALLESEPALDRRLAALGGIPGNVPSHEDVVGTCAFADRCTFVMDACRTEQPPLVELAPGHSSACRRATEIDLVRDDGARVVVATLDHPSDDALLVVDRLCKTFPGQSRPALDNVSLRVHRGEAVAVVGESGSGKTTLARIVVGLETADSGDVLFDGHDISSWAHLDRTRRHELRGRVQMVFQDPYSSLDPRRTIGATLREALRSLGSGPADDQTVDDLLRRVRLSPDKARLKPRSLSGGERQRVGIARALVAEPELLIFDEAVSALDVSVQAQILDLLNELRTSTGMAILLITHDLAVARQTTDTIYVLRAGRLIESGPTARLLDQPQDDYTRNLIDSVPRSDRSWLAATE